MKIIRNIFLIVGIAALTTVAADINCYQCDSKTDAKCIDQPEDKTCSGTKCYTKVKDDLVSRGCLDAEACKDNDCDTICSKDKCNNEPIVSQPTLQCYKCDDCAKDLPDTSLAECTSSYPFGQKEKCFTKSTKVDDKTQYSRGCFYDLKPEDQTACISDSNCEDCEGEKCNNKNYEETTTTVKPEETTPTKKPEETTPSKKPEETTAAPVTTPKPTDDFKCIICRSDKLDEIACASAIKENQFSRKCDIEPKSDDQKACYIKRLSNNVVIRDCITTALALGYEINAEKCDITKDKFTKCNYCNSTNCNIEQPRNSGGDLQIYGSFIALAALIVTRYL